MSSPLRVAVLARAVYPLHGYGGLERHVHDLVRNLTRHGVRVTLITKPPDAGRQQTPDLGGAVSVNLVPYRTFPFAGRRGTTVLDRSTAYPLFGLRAGAVAARLVAEGQVDLVHGLGASVLGYARARQADRSRTAPLVFNPQGLEEFGATDPRRARLKRLGYRPLQAAVRACARAADRIIATDRVLVPSLLQHLRIADDRVRVIPNAIDLEECNGGAGPSDRPAIRQPLGLDSDDVVLLSVGRVEANKGFGALVEALSLLAGDAETAKLLGARWRWVLIGDGPHRSAVERALKARGLSQHAWLAGRLDEAALHAWYEAATLFIHPTLYEGSSIVTLEAMAHRRAVVATKAGGLPDKVQPGVNGWLVDPGDVGALAHAIAEALAHRDRLTAFGVAGRAIVEREFAWPAVVTRLIDVYEEVLADR